MNFFFKNLKPAALRMVAREQKGEPSGNWGRGVQFFSQLVRSLQSYQASTRLTEKGLPQSICEYDHMQE